MNSLLKGFFASSIITSLFLAVLGILLIFESELTIISISYVVGGALISLGIVGVLKFINGTTKGKGNELDVLYGIVTMILGGLVVANPKALASVIPFVLGLCIVINSSSKLQYAFQLKQNNNSLWIATTIVALLSTVCGVVLIFNPFKGATMITQIIGILILIYAVLDVISTITIKRNVLNLKNAINDTIKDAVIIDEHEEKETDKVKEIKEDNK